MKRRSILLLWTLMLICSLAGCNIDEPKVEDNYTNSVTTLQQKDNVISDEKEKTLENANIDEDMITPESQNLSQKGSADENGTLEVHYIDVGQGDSILIKQGDEAMLIDAGNNSKGSLVWTYLLSQNISTLSYVIGTHPDADHIGGLDVVIYKFDCNHIFMPTKTSDTKTYDEVLQTLKSKNQTFETPQQGDVYTLGDATFQVLTDAKKDFGDNTNDYSIAIRLTYGENSFLFTGDAEESAEQNLLESGLNLKCDVYKAAHHGADTANSAAFLQAVSPTYCVISCGMDNSYGHPRAGFLNSLRSMGVSVFRTDEQGTIIAVSDGTGITFNCSPSTTWKAGEPVGSNDTMAENEGFTTGNEGEKTEGTNTYVLNTNTRKFHRENCSSVKRMADKNKRMSNKSGDELIADGYEPCKNCNP